MVEPACTAGRGLLAGERVAAYSLPPARAAVIEGCTVTYALAGPVDGPLVLYFHGWSDDYRAVLPLEYPLMEAGFRLLVPNRPGYGGTALEWLKGRRTHTWRTAADTADVAARLLDQLGEEVPQRVAVVGTSGGAPAALAFASRHAARTSVLLIQAGLTQPWTDARYVPERYRGDYATAFGMFGWAPSRASQAVFGVLVGLREIALAEEDRVKGLTGERLANAQADPAYRAVIALMLRHDSVNRGGTFNDMVSIFFAKSAYCDWAKITAPTLLIHDEKDPLVPIAHAQEALARLGAAAVLRTFALGGHIIWLGPEAARMHEARVEFLKRAS